MSNKITSIFDFRSSGLSKVKADIAGVDGAWNKAKTGFKSATEEFKQSRGAQLAAVGAMTAVATHAINSASALEESINGVKVAYGDMGDEVLAVGENSAEQFGMSARAFNDFAIRISGFANQIATKDGRAVAEIVEELTLRATDFASAIGIDSTEAVTVFMSALAGEAEPMRRYGKDVSAATVEQLLLNEGLVESKSAITESDKVLGRYMQVMRETADTANDFANTQGSLANQAKTATANIDDLSAELGAILIPTVAEAAGDLNDLAAALKWVSDQKPEVENKGWKRALAIFNPVNYYNQVQGWKELRGAWDEAFGNVDENTATHSRFTDAVAAAVAQLAAEKVALEESGKATEYSAEAKAAYARQAGRAENAARNLAWANRDLAGDTDEAAEATGNLDFKLNSLYSELLGILGYIDTQNQLNTLSEQLLAAAAGAEMSTEELAMMRLEVLKFGAEVAGLPTNILTEIDVMIDEESYDEAERRLRILSNARLTPTVTIINPATGAPFGRPTHTGTAHAGGGMTLVGEYGPEMVHLPRGAQVDNHVETARKMGTAGGTVNNISLTVNAGMGTDGRKVGDEILRTIEQALRTGAQVPPTLKQKLS